MIQHIGRILDSKYYKDFVSESLLYYSENKNLKMYYQWCLAHRRTWSDSFAYWIDSQLDITHEKITKKWKELALGFRGRDLNNTIADAVRRKAERAEQENNPNSNYVKRSKLRLDENGMPF